MNQLIKKLITMVTPIRFVNKVYNPVILYHSIGSNSNFDKNTDHIDLKTLENHLLIIKKFWKIVSIDEYLLAKNKKGLASITIDDGYKNVLDEAFEIFKYLEIPFTIFINSSTFKGKIFWRDKIRYLIENNLVKKFISVSKIFKKNDEKDFYFISKNPKFNSKKVELELDNFFFKENIKLNTNHNFCFDKSSYMIKHPLLTYGNHSANHYVMSSLSKDEQTKDILECREFIKSFNVNKSNLFCVPFGGKNYFNDDTINIIKEFGYNGILLSENKLNKNYNYNYINRLMPKKNNILETLKILYLKQLI